jgi:hypothetical protein
MMFYHSADFFQSALELGNIRDLTGTIVLFLFLSGFVDNVIADLLWAKSIVLTSPTVFAPLLVFVILL